VAIGCLPLALANCFFAESNLYPRYVRREPHVHTAIPASTPARTEHRPASPPGSTWFQVATVEVITRPVRRLQPRSGACPLIHSELMAESQDLGLQGDSRSKREEEPGQECPAEVPAYLHRRSLRPWGYLATWNQMTPDDIASSTFGPCGGWTGVGGVRMALSANVERVRGRFAEKTICA
jgi:hypothetical protein